MLTNNLSPLLLFRSLMTHHRDTYTHNAIVVWYLYMSHERMRF